MELIEKILNLYLSFTNIVNSHFYEFSIAFTLISILWIAIVGIVTPVLIISVIAFWLLWNNCSFFIYCFSHSMINFFMVTKTKSVIKKIKKKTNYI